MNEKFGRREFFARVLGNSAEKDIYAQGTSSPWLEKTLQFVRGLSPDRAAFLSFPDYRPDLVQFFSHKSGLRYFDFKHSKMLDLGWEASRITLQELYRCLAEETERSAIVAFNVEALMASKSKTERAECFKGIAENSFGNPLVVVLTLFSDEIGEYGQRHLRLERNDIPEHTVLRRMLEAKNENISRKEHAVLRI